MLLKKLSYLSKKDLNLILETLEEPPKGRLTKRELEEEALKAISKFLGCPPINIEECMAKELARILKTELPQHTEDWPEFMVNRMAERMYNEFLPFVQLAVGVAWADGDFTQEEVEYLDLLFSGFKVMRRYRRNIPDLASEPISLSAFADMFQKMDKDKQRWLLAFGWAMACADGNIHHKERAFLEQVSSLSSLSKEDTAAIRDQILNKWRMALNEKGDTFEAAFRAVDFENILKAHAGIAPLELLRPRAWERRQLLKKPQSAILSLTIFSKVGLITGEELNHRDRVLLLIAVVLLEA